MKKSDKDKILKFALKTAQDAGKVLLDYSAKLHHRPIKIVDKGAWGLASIADLEAEKLVIKNIKNKFPNHKIISEESHFDQGMKDITELDQAWLIDPLDGTNNFLSRLPFFAVSIAYVDQGVSQVAVVYSPLNQEWFWATRGGGAFIQRKVGNKTIIKKIKKITRAKELKDGLISTNLGSKRHNANLIRKFPEVRAFRRLGSAALELSYVAAGILDAYWEYHLSPWDIAAAGLICSEAGVRVTDLDGRTFSPIHTSIVAAREPLYSELFDILSTR
jgi:myo-inositol-1(or 4)-monophosphatase